MKCIKASAKIQRSLDKVESTAGVKPIRVSNEKAASLVKSGNFVYCPKSEWKAAGR